MDFYFTKWAGRSDYYEIRDATGRVLFTNERGSGPATFDKILAEEICEELNILKGNNDVASTKETA